MISSRCYATWNDDGVTIVMVTHNPDIVTATDRVVCMVGGVVTDDTPGKSPPFTHPC
ncbi:MAG: hypothetical protein U0792_01800 [Gemmataceae bacterium]